jgi:NAD+ synthase
VTTVTTPDRTPPASPQRRPLGWEAEYADRLVAWLRGLVAGAGAEGLVLGVSGGLDSAVVAGLASQAYPEASLGLFLSCGSAEPDLEDARAVAKTFNLPLKVVELDKVYETILGAVGDAPPNPMSGRAGPGVGQTPVGPGAQREKLALANLRVRLRAVTWYYHANRLNRLVVGTGNRSELAVGYFTKFGDGAVDLLPLAHLVKAEVRELARHLGVPEPVIARPPTAGLWPGQTDEAEMGLTYELLDRFLLGGEVPPEVASRIRAMGQRSEHKRRPPAVPDF